MSSNIIGYYSDWGPGWIEKYEVTLEDIKNATPALRTATVTKAEGDSIELSEELEEKDLIFQMIQDNKMTVADYCNRTGIVRLMYDNPIPYKHYMEALGFERLVPIFEGTTEFLNLSE